MLKRKDFVIVEENQDNNISLEEQDFQEKLRQIFNVQYLYDFVEEQNDE